MSSCKTEGIIIATVDYNDADVLVHLLTRDQGKILCSARAARSSKKRFFSGIELSMYGVFQLKQKSQRWYLEEMKGVTLPLSQMRNLSNFSFINLILEACYLCIPEGDMDAGELYESLLLSINRVRKSDNYSTSSVIVMSFLLRLTTYLGFDIRHLGEAFREDDFSWMRVLLSGSLITYDPPEASSRAILALVRHLEHYSERKFKSHSFLIEHVSKAKGVAA